MMCTSHHPRVRRLGYLGGAKASLHQPLGEQLPSLNSSSHALDVHRPSRPDRYLAQLWVSPPTIRNGSPSRRSVLTGKASWLKDIPLLGLSF
jgi:hypothetical protein